MCAPRTPLLGPGRSPELTCKHWMVSGRITYIDVARGLAVVAIVLGHVIGVAYVPYADDPAAGSWVTLAEVMTPLRLPTLFVVSGLLASMRVREGFTTRTRSRIRATMHLYVTWYFIYVLLRTVGVDTWVPPLNEPSRVVRDFFLPHSVLWFLFALLFWTTAVTASHRLPAWALLTFSAALTPLVWYLPGSLATDQYLHTLGYGLCFVVGVYARPAILRILGYRPVALLLVAGMLCAGLVAIVRTFDVRALKAALDAPLMLTGAAAVLSFSALISRGGRITRVLSWLGRNALPLYVMHLPLVVSATMLPLWAEFVRIGGPLTPAILTATTIAICLSTHALLVRGPGRYLFQPLPRLRFRPA